jgi:hypothetical protein
MSAGSEEGPEGSRTQLRFLKETTCTARVYAWAIVCRAATRNEYDGRRIIVCRQLSRNLTTVYVRQLNVEQYQLRVELPRGLQRRMAVGRLTDDLVADRLQESPGYRSERAVVVDDEDGSGHTR